VAKFREIPAPDFIEGMSERCVGRPKTATASFLESRAFRPLGKRGADLQIAEAQPGIFRANFIPGCANVTPFHGFLHTTPVTGQRFTEIWKSQSKSNRLQTSPKSTAPRTT